MKRKKIIFLVLLLSSCQAGRMIFYNFADIRDYRVFPNRELKKEGEVFHFIPVKDSSRIPGEITYYGKQYELDHFLEKSTTVAFLVIKNDSLLYEKYFHGYKESSLVASFSMAKSVTSALIGCAIEDGYIKAVQEPVMNFIPELRSEFKDVTIEQLLQMTSGLRFNESYINPFGDAAKFYYGNHLRKYIAYLRLDHQPGTNFKYVSGNTELLGLVLERALKTKTITEYFQEKIWGPLGMEYDASWSIDNKKNGLEKTFCCINARARDFAKLGRLYLDKGNWNGKQLVPKEWVEQSTKVDTALGSVWYYQYQWWIASKTGDDFYADGLLGQYIYVNPAKKLVIVRLGRNHGGVRWREVFREFAKRY